MKTFRRTEITMLALTISALAAAIAAIADEYQGERERRNREEEQEQQRRVYRQRMHRAAIQRMHARHFDPRNGVERWELPEHVPDDVFTFARVKYDSFGWRGDNCMIDWPDSDLNFSLRLQQLTSLNVHPNGVVIRITDPNLSDFPFLYMIEPGRIVLSDLERKTLRNYLLNGGFLMVDDFWGDDEWQVFYDEIKQVFPEREPKELPADHEIFSCVFELKEKPQIPALGVALWHGLSYEPGKSGSEEVHYKALFDDDGRMMAIICHNTDLGDGWEREGEDAWYFRTFSEPKAYPMGINIVFYALTH